MNTLRPRLVAAALALACTATACDDEVAPTPITDRLELRDDMRELWTAHVTWTRTYLMSAIGGLPDAPVAAERLLENQDDIGDAIRPFYGDAAGDELTILLREHIVLATEVVAAIDSGDSAMIDSVVGVWFDNADAIARFFADANPFLRFEELQSMMRDHLEQLLAEATARLGGDWAADVVAYDETVTHILALADVLADGIATQLPELVGPSPLSERDEALHVSMRALWQDHVTWTRVYLIAALGELPDAPFAAERLLRNQDEIGDALRPFYGDVAADQVTTLLREHITGAVEVVEAAAAGDPQALSEANAAWYANADEIASFLAGANPHWSEADLRSMLRAHLDQLTAETVARIGSDWDADVAAYDETVVHILALADILSGGIAAQFPDPGLPPPVDDDDDLRPASPADDPAPVDPPIDDGGYLVHS